MYTHVVFDVDNTLVNSAPAIFLTLQRTLREELGIEKKPEELEFCLGMTSLDMLIRLGVPDVPDAKKRWDRRIVESFAQLELYDGIAPAVAGLKKKGLSLGIVTSRNRAELYDGCISTILPSIDHFVTEEMVTRHKPDPEAFHHYLELSGADRRNVLYIGDTKGDSDCAKAAGVDFALALWGAL